MEKVDFIRIHNIIKASDEYKIHKNVIHQLKIVGQGIKIWAFQNNLFFNYLQPNYKKLNIIFIFELFSYSY